MGRPSYTIRALLTTTFIASIIFTPATAPPTPLTPSKREESGFEWGTCHIALTQYQKETPTSPYQIAAVIYDNGNRLIGYSSRVDSLSATPIHISGLLHNDVIIHTGNLDVEPVLFEYGMQVWTSSSWTGGWFIDLYHARNKRCRSTWEWKDGKREMICDFRCP